MKKKERKFIGQIVELIIAVGFVCFASGFVLAGGAKAQTAQYTYGENMEVNVSIPDLGIDQQVQLYKGMSPFDAILRVTSVKTDYYVGMGSVVAEIGGKAQFWGYKVNGETPVVAMQDYQLRDGDNLLLFKLEW